MFLPYSNSYRVFNLVELVFFELFSLRTCFVRTPFVRTKLAVPASIGWHPYIFCVELTNVLNGIWYFQCGNYGIGGHYWTHPDYHNPSPHHWMYPGSVGNRVATILTILDSPSAGRFQSLALTTTKRAVIFCRPMRLRYQNLRDLIREIKMYNPFQKHNCNWRFHKKK